MAPDICVKIGRRIRMIRTEKGLQQDQLADRSGLSRTSLSRIENGRSEPTIHTLAALAQALGVKLAELLDGVD